MAAKPKISNSMSVQHVPITSLPEVISSTPGVVVVDLFASWCAPCRSYAPQFDQAASYFSADEPVRFLKSDIDENDDKMAVMDLFNIRSIPMTLLYKDGELKTRRQGIVAASELASLVAELQSV